MEILTTASLSSKYRCTSVAYSRTPRHLQGSSRNSGEEFRRKTSSSNSAFTDFALKSSSSHLLLLHVRLPGGRPRCTVAEEDPAPNPKDKSESPSSEAQGIGQKKGSAKAVQNALERAAAYRKLKNSGSSTRPPPPPSRPSSSGKDDLLPVEVIRGQNFQSRMESSSNSSIPPPPPLGQSSPPTEPSSSNSDYSLPVEVIKGRNFQSRMQSSSNSSIPPPPLGQSSPPTRESSSSSEDWPSGEAIEEQNFLPRKQSSPNSVPSTSFSSSSSDADSSAAPPASASLPLANADCRIDATERVGDEVLKAGEGGSGPSSSSRAKSLEAFERSRVYKQQQKEMIAALREEKKPGKEPSSTAAAADSDPASEKVLEIEIVTRDGVIKRKLMNPEEQIRAFSNMKDVTRKGVSGIDFSGLGFADKKKSGRPAGLNEGFLAPPPGVLPEVEILTRDAAGISPSEIAKSDQGSELYKPRVSTWGVFPRPADISKTYGGGRTIRPGESLETEEERKVREARTQQLLVDYRQKMGLDVDPKVRSEAEQVLRQGDGLMDSGRLSEALSLYELAMRKMPAQSELHGLAALQAALCLDSLSRYDDARQLYEKLLVHPNGKIKKQARQFLFGLKAMEKLKVDGGYKWDTSTYRQYFDSFADGYNTTYKAREETRENLLPYALLLLFPIVLVFVLAASKG